MPAAVETASAPNNNGSISAAVQKQAIGASSYLQRCLDWAAPPSSRQRAYDTTSAFASARPVLFSFLVAQALLCFFPLLLFATFSLCTVVFGLGAAIIFALFWIGIALLVLVPALLVASSVAVLVWAWSAGSFLVARWLYQRASLRTSGEVRVDTGGKQVAVVKDEDGFSGSVEHVKAEQ
ncbi:hypothetical protein H634G_00761 [Metarhizium anisopliae BRIP 53293]|uniref:Uncharacterized protein n=1 Tax=Metarhizium anisopliae BRIP 53293 TaxID=1291518 RepID=A0A0D9PDL6_METAN|nr:hypothetical protein H634G_00761 [Metarhizium anisopliae BRIP 53293]KJK90120.1 hypothetical protein H633G_06021 [Metarhizium anisopliae BRIP 53284]